MKKLQAQKVKKGFSIFSSVNELPLLFLIFLQIIHHLRMKQLHSKGIIPISSSLEAGGAKERKEARLFAIVEFRATAAITI